MFTQVGVVPLEDSDAASVEELLPIVAAIQVQVQRDLGPAWGMQAAVSAFPSLKDTPQGAWPVAVTTHESPVDGFHFVMHGLPFGIVKHSHQLSVVLSHEIAEMLVDPFGQRTLAGPSLNGAATVEYFVEVCDPCEPEPYDIDGVSVSDFVLPGYYETDDPHRSRGGQYSFTGALSAPRQVARGGYLTWRDPFPQTSVCQAFGLARADISDTVKRLLGAGALESVANAGSPPDCHELQLLKLPNAPTRAWRELVADLAREEPRLGGSHDQLTAANGDSAAANQTADHDSADPRVQFARAFCENVENLLQAMQNEKPPPSIRELIDALQDSETKTFGQTVLPERGRIPGDREQLRQKIISYLEQQERLAGIFGPDIDTGLASWMYMVMP